MYKRYYFMGCILLLTTFIAQANTESTAVRGVVNLNNSHAQASVVISGFLNANHGKFEGDLLIMSNQAVISDSAIKGSVTMQSDKKSVLELRCKTKITGGVTFKNQPGIVKKSADSIIKGKVTNGTIETLVMKQPCVFTSKNANN